MATSPDLVRYPEYFYGAVGTRERRKRTQKDNHMQRQYNMSLFEYEAMSFAQGHKCAICGEEETGQHVRASGSTTMYLSVDHCHETGEVRGLLCTKCNKAIGLLDDDINQLNKAASYLSASQGGYSHF